MTELFAVGLSHKDAAIELRERLAVSESEHLEVLRTIKDTVGCSELVLVSTCNRVEVYGVAQNSLQAAEVMPALAATRGVAREALDDAVFVSTSAHAARHIFRVAASLESLVVGEPQILGQVKDAVVRAREAGSVGPVLDRCVSLAFKSAKRVRTETEIGRGGASIPSVAVDLAKSIFGDLTGAAVLLVGAGEMAEQAAVHLTAAGASEIVVVNRSAPRGERLAKQVRGHFAPWERLKDGIVRADIVVSSTGARDPILDRKQLKPLMKQRRYRPLFFVDIAVPRDIASDVTKLEGVYLYNVDDLQSIVMDNMRTRSDEAERATGLVDEELRGFMSWLQSRAIGPLMGQLQARGRSIVEAELQRADGKLRDLSPEQRKAVEQVARGVMQKLLHKPMANVRGASESPVGGFDGPALADALQALFGLTTVPAADLSAVDPSENAAPAERPDGSDKPSRGGGEDGGQSSPPGRAVG